MWHMLRTSSGADRGLASSAIDLLRSTTRRLILITAGIYIAWYLLATSGLPATLVVGFFAITVAVSLVLIVSLWLLRRSLLGAQVAWLFGLAALITLASYVSQQPAIAVCYALLPLIAVITVGWMAGLITQGGVGVMLWWFSSSPAMPPVSSGYGLAIGAVGALACVVGWIATQNLLTVAQWSVFSFEQAREKMEEAREQRLELNQVQEDLMHANRELARLSDRLRVMYHVAEEARQTKAEFVANVSHELRTPLNMIIGFSEVITQSPEVYGHALPPTLLADITAIQRNSQHLASLVNDVLDLSQVDAGRMALSKRWASLGMIVHESIDVVQELFDSRGLHLASELPGDLPEVFCDSTRVRQVIINLLSNAGRFTERGGVQVRAWVQQNKAHISIADTGPGIAKEDREKVFEPFQQLDGSIRRRHGGSGLGLSISKRFVEMHGGEMWLESEVGIGTTITFTLPMDAPYADDSLRGNALRWFSPYSEYEYRARTRRSKAPTPDAAMPCYVLLEEGQSLQRLFARYFDDVETLSIPTVEDALNQLARSPAQALVVNSPELAEMPALLARLGELPYEVPVLTCWVPDDDEAARTLGVVRYLTKPVSGQALLTALADVGEDAQQVLMVDDERETLRLFSRFLSAAQRPYQVQWSTTGRRALTLLREHPPDVMLLDLVMPGMDGLQVLREKNQDPCIRDIPVIVVSAKDPREEPIMSRALTVARGGAGLSAQDLLGCIRAASEILAPRAASGGPERRGTPVA